MDVKDNESKVKKICDMLRIQTLKPAQKEAEEIIQKAEEDARNMIKAAKEQINQLQQKETDNRNKQLQSFKIALSLASKQAIEILKQKIDKHLFSDSLNNIIKESFSQKDVIVDISKAIINAIETDGIDSNIQLYLPKHIDKNDFMKLLMEKIKVKLTEKDVEIKDFQAGVKVKLIKDKIILDVSEEAIKEMLSEYMHDDYRNFFFNSLK